MRIYAYLFLVCILFANSVNQSGRKISKKEFGSLWPLTVDEGYVECINGAVIFTSKGKTYAVNGIANGRKKYQDIMPIWKVDPAYNNRNVKMDISPIINAGLKLCK